MDPTVIYGTLCTAISVLFGIFMKDRQDWINRYDRLKESTDAITANAVKIADKVPDIIQMNLTQSMELRDKDKRIAELEK